MYSPLDLQALIDRAAIGDVVTQYATALDTRNWKLLRSILVDPIWIDYSSFDGATDRAMPADEWVQRVTALGGFDATQHGSTNHVHTLAGDSATCISYMQARHFLTWEGAQYHCHLYGYYTNELIRTEAGWKIRKCTLTITAREGDARVFEWAFGAARAAAAEEKPSL